MKLLNFLFLLVIASTAHASKEGDAKAIQTCLKNWGKTPFSAQNPRFKVISTKVRVLGIGSDNVIEDQATTKPELVLIKPNISVLSKTTLSLMNPNGWYCIKGEVSVLGKIQMKLHCKANLASTKDGATVLGSSDSQGSVAVLGSARIERVGCANLE